MKKEYDFSQAKRGAVLPQAGKTRISIYLDDEILDRLKDESEKTGKGYQSLINEVLRAHFARNYVPLTAEVVRKIVREELEQHT
ncbi:MAG: BrnA antitoxin family protein [Methylococcales bacterium]